MELKETTLAQKLLYEGIIVKVRRDQVRLGNGAMAQREVVEHPGGVAIFALDAQERVIMVRQFRYPMGEIVLEIPAGKLELGEDPRASALRELKEETGVTPGRLISLGQSYSSPGIFAEKIHLFFATDLQEGASCPDEDEFLEVVRVPLATLLEDIENNQILDAKTIVACMKALLLRKRERAGEAF